MKIGMAYACLAVSLSALMIALHVKLYASFGLLLPSFAPLILIPALKALVGSYDEGGLRVAVGTVCLSFLLAYPSLMAIPLLPLFELNVEESKGLLYPRDRMDLSSWIIGPLFFLSVLVSSSLLISIAIFSMLKGLWMEVEGVPLPYARVMGESVKRGLDNGVLYSALMFGMALATVPALFGFMEAYFIRSWTFFIMLLSPASFIASYVIFEALAIAYHLVVAGRGLEEALLEARTPQGLLDPFSVSLALALTSIAYALSLRRKWGIARTGANVAFSMSLMAISISMLMLMAYSLHPDLELAAKCVLPLFALSSIAAISWSRVRCLMPTELMMLDPSVSLPMLQSLMCLALLLPAWIPSACKYMMLTLLAMCLMPMACIMMEFSRITGANAKGALVALSLAMPLLGLLLLISAIISQGSPPQRVIPIPFMGFTVDREDLVSLHYAEPPPMDFIDYLKGIGRAMAIIGLLSTLRYFIPSIPLDPTAFVFSLWLGRYYFVYGISSLTVKLAMLKMGKGECLAMISIGGLIGYMIGYVVNGAIRLFAV